MATAARTVAMCFRELGVRSYKIAVTLLIVLGYNIAPAQIVLPRRGNSSMSRETPKNTSSGKQSAHYGLQEEAAMPYEPDQASGYAGQSRVEIVRARNERTLLAIDGVVGAGVGRTPIGDDAIVLYLRDASVKQRVPAQVEGYPVETTVTGEIDAYSGTGPRQRRF